MVGEKGQKKSKIMWIYFENHAKEERKEMMCGRVEKQKTKKKLTLFDVLF